MIRVTTFDLFIYLSHSLDCFTSTLSHSLYLFLLFDDCRYKVSEGEKWTKQAHVPRSGLLQDALYVRKYVIFNVIGLEK
ncbi:unnamed protein product [Callosobruchus maculatus]|uniref:Uncharacterized protein n=1 Tax=Callosobruchus maculatus TaxID=64391 RepID=A0A653DWC5_CALMS|nr:unnamed protein product [Callosobruchus maculatus]